MPWATRCTAESSLPSPLFRVLPPKSSLPSHRFRVIASEPSLPCPLFRALPFPVLTPHSSVFRVFFSEPHLSESSLPSSQFPSPSEPCFARSAAGPISGPEHPIEAAVAAYAYIGFIIEYINTSKIDIYSEFLFFYLKYRKVAEPTSFLGEGCVSCKCSIITFFKI